MATRTTLKSYFETGDKPTQTQFEALIDGVPNLTDSSVTDAEFSYLNGTTSAIQTQIDSKQATLVNQTNIKSVNGETLLGSGDLTVSSSAAWGGITGTLSSQTDLQTALDLKADLAGATFTGDVTAPDFIGDLNGAVRFTGKAIGSAILAGEVVYISGISGNTPEIQLAQSNSSATMPAFGIALADIAQNNTGEVATFGSVKGLDVTDFGETTITFSLGETIYVSASEAGKLTNVPPSGESNLIQNIGKIERANPTSNMTIKVGGAGRTNATPNLDSAKIFLGNASNQSVATAVTGEVTISNTGVTEVTSIDGNISIQGFRPYSRETTTERTLALTDAGTFISAENVGGTEVTIPTNATVAFTQGTEIDFIQKTAGTLTLTAAAGVTLNGAVAGSVEVTAQWGGVTIKLIADDEWIAVGKI